MPVERVTWWPSVLVIGLAVACGCGESGDESRTVVRETRPEHLPPLPEPLALTDDMAREIRAVVVRFPFVSDVEVAVDEAAEPGRTVRVTVLVSREITFEDASRIIERAIEESRDALEPETPDSENIGWTVLHYEATVVATDAENSVQGVGRKVADAESIEWREGGE